MQNEVKYNTAKVFLEEKWGRRWAGRMGSFTMFLDLDGKLHEISSLYINELKHKKESTCLMKFVHFRNRKFCHSINMPARPTTVILRTI